MNDQIIQSEEEKLEEKFRIHGIIAYSILYPLGFFLYLPAMLGVLTAYTDALYKNVPEWYQTHIQFQIGTFWLGAAAYPVKFFVPEIYITPYLLGLFIWLAMRCLRGVSLVLEREPVPNPNTLFVS